MLFNVNDYVYVRLTQHGLDILRQEHEKLGQTIHQFKRPFVAPTQDEQGYSQFQMHELMALFGDHVGNGFDIPFETEIKILPKNQE